MTIASDLLQRHIQTLVDDNAQWQTLIAATNARTRPSGDSATSLAGNGKGLEKYIVRRESRALTHQAAPTPTAISNSKTASHQPARSQFLRLAETCTGTPFCESASAIQFNSLARSVAVCQRSSGSLASHLLTTRSNAGRVIGCKAAMGCGSEERMAAIKLGRLFPANAGLPVAIS